MAQAAAATTFTGLGFDACSAPSESAMQAWASTYEAAGIYIGGANSACSQPNLTSTWVGDETAAGWHLIPTYVGLQAPSNSCGCAPIVPARAAAEGTAAATDAVTRTEALGLGPGNPIYFDMEAYNPSTMTTAAVLTFLSAWTTQLHADHYLSGVYSSSDSGIRDVAAAVGSSSFVAPDDLWIANWNGTQSTVDPNVPSTVFVAHHRLHQYAGAHNETHSRVTINVDSDYLDGATAQATLLNQGGIPVPPTLTPSLLVSPAPDGTVGVHASWPGVAGLVGWRLLAGTSPTALSQLGTAVMTTGDAQLLLHSEFPYFEAQALDASGQPLGSSSVVPTPPHLAIYGASAFVGSHGNGTVPAGCFTAGSCVVSTTIAAGSSVIARTGGEVIPARGTRILHFKLSPKGQAKLAAAAHQTLPVRVVARDVSGVTAATALKLVGFAVTGRSPARAVGQSSGVQIVGATDFVYRHRTGGILAGCVAAAPCKVSAKLSAGRSVIATTPARSLGANALGYVRFVLTSAGRSLMAHVNGNQLGVRVSLVDSVSGARASGRIVLIGYG